MFRLARDNMGQQAQQHAEQIAPVLRAALVAPMAQFDYATVQAILDESKATEGIDYIAVLDRRGNVAAISGWPIERPLPAPDGDYREATAKLPPRFDVSRPITLAGQTLGTLQFGLDLKPIVAARQSLLRQGAGIAFGELLLSAGVLSLLVWMITRQLPVLTRASEQVASGGTPPRVPEGGDDIGQLGAAFNAMAEAIDERV